ncbi:UDP-N-acetylmuramate dehydrogenase [Anaerobium acetethylicum]|uniref:UDP-N-acetylenolpyruvoylglucosamine reductase n=1 Tax=Anaerobium acetethylicum TaxID=1619234 RepID=A0A1D3TU40_9FIRM|nr:UDP-N-acetylmuramate dehydrogenase [Anaerobium acetethylicum]SCP97550.1 UDP-N-acetylmuramate dehydrogenase [Anaerobium acetethylicum]
MNKDLYGQLCEIVGSDCVKLDESMKMHTTFKVGGNADYYVMPNSAEEISRIIELCRKTGTDYYVLGRGSNLLVSDEGYRGVIIQIYRNMRQIELDGVTMRAQAGALLSEIAAKAAENSLTGLEFAAGIPGTVGGALVMNAGAYDGEMKDVVISAKLLTLEGDMIELSGEEMEFAYRSSLVEKKNYIVLEATMKLRHGDRQQILDRMKELRQMRETKQPIQFPSAGSTFKRPEGHFAGKLIMDAGLRGFSIGGAQVSEKHCGFVINKGGATAKDVIQLIKYIKKEVKSQTGIELKAEVKLLGNFQEDK